MEGRWAFWGLIIKIRFKPPWILKYQWGKGNLSASFDFLIWTGCGFYFLCICLSQSFLWEQTQSAGFLERILVYSGFRFGNSKFPLLVPLEVRCESILVFYCTDERSGGKDRLGFVEWSSQKIKVADLLLGAVWVWHLLPAHPYSHAWN